MRFQHLVIFCFIPISLNSQVTVKSIKDLHVKPGIYGQLNFVDSKAFNVGFNLIATHGLLANDRFVFYGTHLGLTKFGANSLNDFGIEFGLSSKFYNRFPLGLELEVTSIYLKENTLLLPTIGIGYFGVFSINYGYYISLNEISSYDFRRHHIALKLTLNLSSGEFLNMVGRSHYKW